MTITLIIPQPPAYSETFFNAKIKGLQEGGHRVILVTAATDIKFTDCKHLQHPKVDKNQVIQIWNMLLVLVSLLPKLKVVFRFIKLEKKEGTSLKRIIEKLYLNATLLKLKTDWLHFGFATMAIHREVVAKAIGAKMAVSLRGYDISVYPLKHPNCYKKLWKYVDKVHSISAYLLEKANQQGLPKSVKKQLIHPAVDGNTLNEIPKKKSEKLVLLTIARLHWVKGIDELITTAYLLKQANINFEWQVIGDIQTEEAERFLYHAYQKGLQEEVKFVGKQTHKETLTALQRADMYLQTSLNEGFCNAVLEAQAVGKICIAYHSGALAENIIDGVTGFLVPKLQPKLLASKIIEVLKFSDAQKQIIQNNAKQRVKEEFGLEKHMEEFKEFYTINE